MRKCDNYFRVYCYRYAPESFKAWYNGAEISLNADERSECGGAYCTNGKPAAIAALKRIIRKRESKIKYLITYGNFYLNKPTSFAYTEQLAVDGNSLADRLYAYRAWKNYCEDNNYFAGTVVVEEGNFNPYGKNTATSKVFAEALDKNRKIKLGFRTETIYQ